MRGEDNFLLSPLSSPPSAQGQTPQDALQAPNQVRKHGGSPPGVLSSEEVPQARPPGSFPRAGRKAGPYMMPGWEHWLLVS